MEGGSVRDALDGGRPLDARRVATEVALVRPAAADARAPSRKGAFAFFHRVFALPRDCSSPRAPFPLCSQGMAHLHSVRVCHRDLKAANVLLDASGRAKVADFGLARRADVSDTMSAVGTPLWTAPEAAAAFEQYDERCDVYSYAFLLLELADFRKVHDVYARDH
eukprot:336765-Prymnesium_polylepis.1